MTRPAATHTSPRVDAYLASGTSPTTRVSAAGRQYDVPWTLTGNPGGELVVVLGGISADRHPAATAGRDGWWSCHVRDGGPIDTRRYAVLSFDYLGGPACGPRGGAGPAEIATTDQAAALAAILDALGESRVYALIGASYGGMVGLAFAAAYPARLERLVAISAAHRSHPMATAWRSVQRDIVELGQAGGAESRGLTTARALAMTTYRSAAEFDARFGAPDDVTGYLSARSEAFAERFDAASFLALSRSLDAHRIDPGAVRTPTWIVAVDQDALVPAWLCRELRDGLAGPVVYRELSSVTGHDAFLAEPATIGECLRSALGGGGEAGPATRAVRAAIGSDPAHGAVMPPLYLSSNFTFAGFDRKRRHDYSRTSNPTRDHLAEVLAGLEGGCAAVVTSSGMSAVALALQLLRPGERLVATHDCYGGLHRLVCAQAARGAFEADFVDLTAPDVADRLRDLRPRMVWIETPSNPLLRVTDLRAVADAAHALGAVVVVDNTLMSPAWQRPIEHGADIVVHSTTKFINGHSDVVGGAAIAAEPAVAQELAWWGNCLGVTGAPFDSYLTLRGVRTLHARTRVHADNAALLAETLAGHEAVAAVHYPGLPDHPGHALAARQQHGFGSMLSFELADEQAVRRFLRGLTWFSLAESLGGVESLVAHPATMTHAAMTPEARRRAGIGSALLRLSVGIEDGADLRADLQRALDRAAATRAGAGRRGGAEVSR